MKVTGEVHFLFFAILCSMTLTAFGVKGDTSFSQRLHDVNKLINSRLNAFKLEVHRIIEMERLTQLEVHGILEMERLTRQKRETMKIKPENDVKNFAAENITEDVSVTRSTDQVGQKPVIIGARNGAVYFLHKENGTFLLDNSFRPNAYNILKLEAFYSVGQLWLIIHFQRSNGSEFLQSFLYKNSSLSDKQVLKLTGKSLIEGVYSKNTFYLATVSSGVEDKESRFSLLEWRGTQFDEIIFSDLKNVQMLSLWDIDGSLYIFFAMSRNRSMIFQCSQAELKPKLFFVQLIELQLPQIIRHFEIEYSHYLILARNNSADILWWSGNEYLLWQTLKLNLSGMIIDAVPLKSARGVILAFASIDVIEYFILDSSAHYIKIRTNKTSEDPALKSVVEWQNISAYPVISQFLSTPLIENLGSIIKAPADVLIDCLQRVDSLLDSRNKTIDEAQNKLKKVWFKNTSSSLEANVTINGSVKTKDLMTGKVTIRVKVESASPSNVMAMLDDLSNETSAFNANHVVRNSINQTIPSDVYFSKTINATKGYLQVSPDIDPYINGIRVSSLHFALKRNGHQQFPPETRVNDLVVAEMNITGFLNDTKVEDFMLLSGYQSVTGALMFRNISATNIYLPANGSVNGVTLDEIILTTDHGSINDEKFLYHVMTQTVDCTNKTNLSLYSKKVIYLDRLDVFLKTKLSFISTVIINGSLSVRGTIGHKVNNLGVLAVRKEFLEIINGTKTFTKGIKITQDIKLLGRINQIQSLNLVTIYNQQNISGNLIFSNMTFHGNVNTHAINKIDIEYDSIHSKNIYVSEKKIFVETLKIKQDIIMIKNSLIDGVDPSEMEQLVLTHENGIFKKPAYFKDIIVGNVTIGDNSSFPLLDLRNHVWLKSHPQRVVVPVYFVTLKVQDIKNLSYLNNSSFKDNFVTVAGNYSIKNSSKFKNPVFIKLLDVNPGVHINGVELSSFDALLPSRHNWSTLYGNITLPSMVIRGSVQKLLLLNNKTYVKDFVQKSSYQIFEALKTFSKITTSNVNALDVILEKINDIHFANFTDNSVKRKYLGQAPISNKMFRNISGKELIVEGLISNISFQNLAQRVVTLDSPQNISIQKDFASIDVLGLRISRLFNWSFDELINNIVQTNKTEHIYGIKVFSKKVHVNALIPQFLNEMNLTILQQKAMLKTSENDVLVKMNFSNYISCKNDIEILENNAVDGVMLNDLLKLNDSEILKFPVNFTHVTVLGDVQVKGLINECDIAKVLSNSLRFKTEEQIFSNRTNIKYLVVSQNLDVQCTMNNIVLSELEKVVDRYSNSSIFGRNFYFANLSVARLVLLKSLNAISLSFLISDAVKSSEAQVIREHKIFLSNLNVTNLRAVSVTVENDPYGIYSFENVVRKQGKQTILGNLTIGNVNATKVAIKGELNGIKIPDDVILANDKSNFVDSDTIFNTSIILYLNLTVSGRIGNVLLASEFQRNVLLNSPETIYAKINFANDVNVTGATRVEKLNDIIVDQFILLKGQNVTVSGSKTFHNLTVRTNDISVSSINDIDVSNLSTTALRTNSDENIDQMIFLRAVFAPSLNVSGRINNISLNFMWDQIHEEIDSAEENSYLANKFYNENEEFLTSKLDAVPFFGYFELHQRLQLGSTVNFLPVLRSASFPEITEYVGFIVWVDKCETAGVFCCKDMDSMRMKINLNGTLTSVKKYNGKVFHFMPSNTKNDVNGFLLQSKMVKDNGKCNKQYHIVVKTCFEAKNKTMNYLSSSARVIDAFFVEMKEALYVAVLYGSKGLDSGVIVLYQYDWEEDQWTEYQRLSMSNPTSMDFTYIETKTDSHIFLAVSFNSTQVPLSFYEWDVSEEKFFDVQNLTSARSSSTVFWVENGLDLFLLCTNEKSSIQKDNTIVYVYTDPIQVYRKQDDDLIFYQIIDLGGIYSFESFRISEELFVLAVSRYLQTVYVIQWKGFSGFQVIQSIPAPGVVKVSVFFLEDKQLMLAVASQSGHTKILKGVVRKFSRKVTDVTFS